MLDDVHERVRSGTALSDAFAAHGDLFPRVYTASLLAGERSGNLDAVLRRYRRVHEDHRDGEAQDDLGAGLPGDPRSRWRSVLVSIIVLKVVPAFSDFYASFGAELPLVTRIIVGDLGLRARRSSAAADRRCWSRGRGVRRVGPAAGQKARFDRLMLSVPMLGESRAKFATSQMARTLATLLGGGLPLVNALDIAAQVGRQPVHGRAARHRQRARARRRVVRRARSRRGSVFPEVAVKMAEVGESTGALQDMLNTVADFYDEEIATNMERFVTLVEPVLLVVMGIVIAGLLLALYMPLFQLSSVLAQ